jgi:hypothetical protein
MRGGTASRWGETASPAQVVQPYLPPSATAAQNVIMTLVWYVSRATWRQCWQLALIVTLMGGLLGAVSLGALAGARRTDSAYARYLASARASDVLVDVPGPLLSVIKDVEREPGTRSSAAWIGMNAQPVIHGRIDASFLTDALTGSLDGEFYRQDKLTVLAGRLPPSSATDEVILTPSMASTFHLTVGDRMTWQFYRSPLVDGLPTSQQPLAYQRVTFGVAAIAVLPPALTDKFDETSAAILPPAATARFLDGEWQFGWAAIRLRGGDAGVPALRQELAGLASSLARRYGFPLTFTIRRMAIVQHEAQQAIEPQALALAVLGGLAALALLVLMAQGMAQLLSRSAAAAPVLRGVGASRRQAVSVATAWSAVAVLGAVLIAVGAAIAVSPLAPVGPVRHYDPVRGVEADWLLLGAGGATLLVVLTAMLAWLGWHAIQPRSDMTDSRPSLIVTVAIRAGLPITAVTGVRHALDRVSGPHRVPVRATLTGSVVAVIALVAALVFGASLAGLAAHPEQYGWNWTLLVQAEGGWGNWAPVTIRKLVDGQPGVTGWSEFGFGQLTIQGTEVPVMGLELHPGSRRVEPPTTSGHALTGSDQIELGTVTMRQLGLRIGDRIRIGSYPRPLTVVGTVTLPSFGVVLTDHVSLGRGALIEEGTLLRTEGLPAEPFQGAAATAISSPSYPSTAAIDLSSAADATALAARITSANPDGTPGGTYRLGPQLGAPVVNASQMGSLPVTLAAGVAAAAVLALALTILASVRQRRRDLALLKALGLRASQVRAVVAWQISAVLVVASLAGIPIGIVTGRWAWTSFANAIGVVPAPVVPELSLVLGVGALITAANLLAAAPAHVAARIPAAVTLRAE